MACYIPLQKLAKFYQNGTTQPILNPNHYPITEQLCRRFQRMMQQIVSPNYRFYDIYGIGGYGAVMKFCNRDGELCEAVKIQIERNPRQKDEIEQEVNIQQYLAQGGLAPPIIRGLELSDLPVPSRNGTGTVPVYSFTMKPIITDLDHYLQEDIYRFKQVLINILVLLFDKNQSKIIHGDMHLGNMALMRTDQGNIQAVLIDFGQSRFQTNPIEQFVDMIPFISNAILFGYRELGMIMLKISNLIYGTQFIPDHFKHLDGGGFGYIIPDGPLRNSKLVSFYAISNGGIMRPDGTNGFVQELQELWPTLKPLDTKQFDILIHQATKDPDDLIQYLNNIDKKQAGYNLAAYNPLPLMGTILHRLGQAFGAIGGFVQDQFAKMPARPVRQLSPPQSPSPIRRLSPIMEQPPSPVVPVRQPSLVRPVRQATPVRNVRQAKPARRLLPARNIGLNRRKQVQRPEQAPLRQNQPARRKLRMNLLPRPQLREFMGEQKVPERNRPRSPLKRQRNESRRIPPAAQAPRIVRFESPQQIPMDISPAYSPEPGVQLSRNISASPGFIPEQRLSAYEQNEDELGDDFEPGSIPRNAR